MSFFRPSLFRQDPFFSPSYFPRTTTLSPFTSSFFDYPIPSTPLYTLYHIPSPTPTLNPPSPTPSRKQLNPQPSEEKSASPRPPSSTSSPSSVAVRSPAKDRQMTGKASPSPSRQQSLFAPLPSLFSSLASPIPQPLDMSIDMFSNGKEYTVQASVPGVDKSDIRITVDDHVLSIEAERRGEKTIRRPTTTMPSTTTSTSSQPAQEATHTGEKATTTQSSTAGTTQASQSSPSSSTSSQSNASGASTAPVETKEAKTEEKYPDPSDPQDTTTMTDAPHGGEGEGGDEDVAVHHVESWYGRVSRRVQLPEDARVEELTARYEDGIIHITVPRTQEQKTRGRRIEIQ